MLNFQIYLRNILPSSSRPIHVKIPKNILTFNDDPTFFLKNCPHKVHVSGIRKGGNSRTVAFILSYIDKMHGLNIGSMNFKVASQFWNLRYFKSKPEWQDIHPADKKYALFLLKNGYLFIRSSAN